jgi:hypothetical protein
MVGRIFVLENLDSFIPLQNSQEKNWWPTRISWPRIRTSTNNPLPKFSHYRIFSDILGYSRILSDILGYSRIFSDVLGYSQIFSDILGYSRIFSDILGYSRIFSDVLWFSRCWYLDKGEKKLCLGTQSLKRKENLMSWLH